MTADKRWNTGNRDLVPIEPLREWLLEYTEFGGELSKLAETSGASVEVLRRIRNNRQRKVSIHTVDTVCVAMGLHISELYGDRS